MGKGKRKTRKLKRTREDDEGIKSEERKMVESRREEEEKEEERRERMVRDERGRGRGKLGRKINGRISNK